MYNLHTNFVKILEICKQFTSNLVNEHGYISRRGPIPKLRFDDCGTVVRSGTESIDTEKWLFAYKLHAYRNKISNLISRCSFNDWRKKTAGLCESIRKRLACKMTDGENFFIVDSKLIEVYRVALGGSATRWDSRRIHPSS